MLNKELSKNLICYHIARFHKWDAGYSSIQYVSI
jgi:hypothetical protein